MNAKLLCALLSIILAGVCVPAQSQEESHPDLSGNDPHWIKIDDLHRNCWIYDATAQSGVVKRVTWNGECENNLASGNGTQTWYLPNARNTVISGTLQRGVGVGVSYAIFYQNGAPYAHESYLMENGKVVKTSTSPIPNPQPAPQTATNSPAQNQNSSVAANGPAALITRTPRGSVFQFLDVAVDANLTRNMEECGHVESTLPKVFGSQPVQVECWNKFPDGSYEISNGPDLGFSYDLAGYLDDRDGMAYRFMFSVGQGESINVRGQSVPLDPQLLASMFVRKYGNPTTKREDAWVWKFEQYSITLVFSDMHAVIQDDVRAAAMAEEAARAQANRTDDGVRDAINKF